MIGNMARKLILVVLAVALGAGVALASIPDRNGTIHGCRNVRTGVLRAIKSQARCRTLEKPLNWNVQGRQGDIGPAGPQGPAGVQGPPGPALASFDALAGLACTIEAETGTIAIDYDAVSGDAHIRCVLPPAPSADLRINEFSTGTEGAPTDEFVEVAPSGPAEKDHATSDASGAVRCTPRARPQIAARAINQTVVRLMR